MLIKTLVENTTRDAAFGCQHGLSLYVETNKHRILFDMGADDLFAKNAEKMGVDLPAVDVAFISHGHSDHGGGLKAFLQLNSKACVYANAKAFEPRYARRQGGLLGFIGLDESLSSGGRVILVEGSLRIDDELTILAMVSGSSLRPTGNSDLFMKAEDGSMVFDDFSHEQNLAIRDGDNSVLIAGCAHNGIVNILEAHKNTVGEYPHHVIGGFHMFNKSTGESEEAGFVKEVASHLISTGARFYTCHCTGEVSYYLLKGLIGDRISYLATGSSLTL